MSNVAPRYDDEIDLINLIQIIWDGKWKIAFIIVVSLLSVFVFNILKSNKTFIASTDIKPITSFESDKYGLFNSSLNIIKKEEKEEDKEDKEDKEGKMTNIFKITPKILLNLYVEEIEEGSLLESAIDKFNLINKDNFENEADYKDAIEKFVSQIEVLKPIKEKNKTREHHILKAKFNNKDKWKDLLSFVNNEANRKVKASIINRFANVVSIQKQKKIFAIKDVEKKIYNAKKDYTRNTKNRLAFLAEQAAIARKLDIQKNTTASQRFNVQNTFVTYVKTDPPFYLRGFLAIEEEIKQIKNRKDRNAFTPNLFKLEQEKRNLEQDETMQRAVDLFNITPINQTDFQATIVKVATTDFKKNNNNKILYYSLAIIFSGIVGIVYVLIANALQNRKITQ